MKPIIDPRGQWAHPGKVTTIPGNNITMKGVPYPVLGISNTGDKKLMMPNKNYKFRGTAVTEYPWLKKYQLGGAMTLSSGTSFPGAKSQPTGTTGVSVTDPYNFSYSAGVTKLTPKQWKKLDAAQQQAIWREALISKGFTQIGDNAFTSNGQPDSFQLGGAIGTTVGTALNFIPGIGPIASQIATPLLTALGQKIEADMEGGGKDKKVSSEKMMTQNPFGFQKGGAMNSAKPGYKEIYDYLVGKGVSHAHAVGMLANIKAESNFNPGAIGDKGTSGGLFQHHNTRFDAMKKMAGENWASNWQGQVDYALSENDTKKYLSQSFTTPEEASKWFTINWERPADKYTKADQRIAHISKFDLASAPAPAADMSLMPSLPGMAMDNTRVAPVYMPIGTSDRASTLAAIKPLTPVKKAMGGKLPGKLIPLKQEGKFEDLGDGFYIAKGPSHAKGGIDADLAIEGVMDGSPEINLEGGEIVDDTLGYIYRKNDVSSKYLPILKKLKGRTDQVSRNTRQHMRSMMYTHNESLLAKEGNPRVMQEPIKAQFGLYTEGLSQAIANAGTPYNTDNFYTPAGTIPQDGLATQVSTAATTGLVPFGMPKTIGAPVVTPGIKQQSQAGLARTVPSSTTAASANQARFNNTTGDWAQLAGIAVPTIYNAIKAFEPAEEVNPVNNPYENRVKGLMSNRFYNEQAAQNQITRAMNSGINQINNMTNSASVRRANITNLIGNTEQQRATANMQGQQMNNAYRAEEANTLNMLGQQRVQATNLAQQINYANRGAKDAYGVAAVEGIGQGLTAFGGMKNAKAYNNTALMMMNSAFPNYYWDINTLNSVASGSKPSWMSDEDFSKAQAILYRS